MPFDPSALRPEVKAQRMKRILYRLRELEEEAEAPNLEFARDVYYLAVQDTAAPPEEAFERASVNNPEVQNDFIAHMVRVAREEDWSYIATWADNFSFLPIFDSEYRPLRTWLEVKAGIKPLMKEVKERLNRYLDRQQLLPVWRVPESWRSALVDGVPSDLKKHIRKLAIPAIDIDEGRSVAPDLMMYKIGLFAELDDGLMDLRTLGMLDTSDHSVLFNVSGSGKTRLLFETLRRAWGLYFACARDDNTSPYGSSDIATFFTDEFLLGRRTNTGRKFDPLEGVTRRSSDHMAQIRSNVAIVEHMASLVLLARMLVLKALVKLYNNKYQKRWTKMWGKEEAESRARLAWLYLQIFPHIGEFGELRSSGEDLFQGLVQGLLELDEYPCVRAIEYLRARIAPVTLQYLVFDEVQTVADRLSYAFAGGENATAGRALLKPIANGIAQHVYKPRLLVAGTRLRKDKVMNALLSKVFKRDTSVQSFSNFGGFFREQDILRVLNHFFTREFVDALPADIKDNITMWFSGRHRFLMFFIQWTLCEGPAHDDIRNVINNIVYAATGEKLPGYPFKKLPLHIKSLIPESFPKIPTVGTITTIDASSTLKTVRSGILTFLCYAEFPTYDPEQVELIDQGIGRFFEKDESGRITIFERLVLCSLMSYFCNPRNPVGIRGLLNQSLSKHGSSNEGSGYGYEDGMIYLFWDLFGREEGTVLSEVFEFPSSGTPGNVVDMTPDWAHCHARLISDWSGDPIVVRHRLTAVLAHHARGMDDSLSWFLDKRRAPFLKPDVRFGPDIIFALQLYCPDNPALHGRLLLVCVTCKKWSAAKGGDKVTHALYTASPEGFYSSLTGKSKEDAIRTLKPILRQYFPPLPGNKRPGPPPPVTAAQLSKESTEVPRAYGDSVDYAVLRCMACFPDTVRLPPVSTAQGVYPLSVLTHGVLELGGYMGFDAFRSALALKGGAAGPTVEQLLEEENNKFLVPNAASSRPRVQKPAVDPLVRPADPNAVIVDYFLSWSCGELVEWEQTRTRMVEREYLGRGKSSKGGKAPGGVASGDGGPVADDSGDESGESDGDTDHGVELEDASYSKATTPRAVGEDDDTDDGQSMSDARDAESNDEGRPLTFDPSHDIAPTPEWTGDDGPAVVYRWGDDPSAGYDAGASSPYSVAPTPGGDDEEDEPVAYDGPFDDGGVDEGADDLSGLSLDDAVPMAIDEPEDAGSSTPTTRKRKPSVRSADFRGANQKARF